MLLLRVCRHPATVPDEHAVEMGEDGWKRGVSLCPRCCLISPQVILIFLGTKVDDYHDGQDGLLQVGMN